MSTYTVINPATASPVKDISMADLTQTDAVIAKAHKAFETWRKVSPGDRAKLLRSFARIVDEHIEELALLDESRCALESWRIETTHPHLLHQA